ncbi:MAG: hypothetical protein KA248_01950 [Kiritimatiellae bacterium]|nr:hypothetical protein [Kiritimatiellia bacterium]
MKKKSKVEFYNGALVLRQSADRYGARELWLGTVRLCLRLREFIVLKVLCLLAVADYLAVPAMLDAIAAEGRRYLWRGRDVFQDPAPGDVHRLVAAIRKDLEAAGCTACVIETNPRRDGGYRLHASRVILDLPWESSAPEQR